ncbi:MAG: YdeI/OmpD-associated family protein [Defluviitaleaceae bacterium]|nr:YdeI/OmpD-associated family protein [Defluviitaleaceae bacterium]
MKLDKNKIYEPDIPMGLDFALAQNERAKDYFYSLPEAAQKMIINRTHTINSKEEMKIYVDSLAGDDSFC